MVLHKPKDNSNNNANLRRFLVTITGSAGPIRFVVNDDDTVASAIETCLRSYAREGRLLVLGYDVNSFVLCCAIAQTQVLHPRDTIGSVGVRNFTLGKKPNESEDLSVATSAEKLYLMPSPKGANVLKAWLHMTRRVKTVSH